MLLLHFRVGDLYKMEAANYKKLLHENMAITYKKADQRKINNINRDAKMIAIDLDLKDRIEKMH